MIKFKEGTEIRLRGNTLTSSEEGALPPSAGIGRATMDAELLASNDYLAAQGLRLKLKRLFNLSESALSELKARGEKRSKKQLADLNLYFGIDASAFGSAEMLENVRSFFNDLDSVEVAYVQPVNVPAAIIAPPDVNTPDYTGSQGYKNPAPEGIDADYASTFSGGLGENVQVIDVEAGWNLSHEDFPAMTYQHGTNATTDLDWFNHGTAVMGEIAGQDNGFGVTGIVPNATVGFSSFYDVSTSSAIAAAASSLSAGDVMLLEVQRTGPTTTTCTCNTAQCNMIAIEYWQADFDAIQTATANGIIVVEAAGNGSVNFDDSGYDGLFDRTVRDSGAIVVGASESTSRAPTCWSNHGSRVDVHAWGYDVFTLGYGDLYTGSDPDDMDDWYTGAFSGTSSASPIVVGSAAALQSISKGELGRTLTPEEVRALLSQTGTVQTADTDRPIGPLPDLRGAVDTLMNDIVCEGPFVSTLDTHVSQGRVYTEDCDCQTVGCDEVCDTCYFASGSKENLGTDGNATTSLWLYDFQGADYYTQTDCQGTACVPISTDDTTCDGVDDDCDGEFDEDCLPECISAYDSNANHVTAGRAYTQDCNCQTVGCDQICDTCYYATGTGEDLGIDPDNLVTLYSENDGATWSTSSCEI